MVTISDRWIKIGPFTPLAYWFDSTMDFRNYCSFIFLYLILGMGFAAANNIVLVKFE